MLELLFSFERSKEFLMKLLHQHHKTCLEDQTRESLLITVILEPFSTSQLPGGWHFIMKFDCLNLSKSNWWYVTCRFKKAVGHLLSPPPQLTLTEEGTYKRVGTPVQEQHAAYPPNCKKLREKDLLEKHLRFFRQSWKNRVLAKQVSKLKIKIIIKKRANKNLLNFRSSNFRSR